MKRAIPMMSERMLSKRDFIENQKAAQEVKGQKVGTFSFFRSSGAAFRVPLLIFAFCLLPFDLAIHS